jgi:hypothetical protein
LKVSTYIITSITGCPIGLAAILVIMSVSTFKAAVILHISAIKACVTQWLRGCRDCDRMVVGFTTTCAMSAYHHKSCQFEPRSWWGVLYITLCDKVCQWLATGRWFSAGTPASSTKKTDCHDITEILLKVALNTINEAKLTQWLICQYVYAVSLSVTVKSLLFVEYQFPRN